MRITAEALASTVYAADPAAYERGIAAYNRDERNRFVPWTYTKHGWRCAASQCIGELIGWLCLRPLAFVLRLLEPKGKTS